MFNIAPPERDFPAGHCRDTKLPPCLQPTASSSHSKNDQGGSLKAIVLSDNVQLAKAGNVWNKRCPNSKAKTKQWRSNNLYQGVSVVFDCLPTYDSHSFKDWGTTKNEGGPIAVWKKTMDDKAKASVLQVTIAARNTFRASELTLEATHPSLLCLGPESTHLNIQIFYVKNQTTTVKNKGQARSVTTSLATRAAHAATCDFLKEQFPLCHTNGPNLDKEATRWEKYTNAEGIFEFNCDKTKKACTIPLEPAVVATQIRLDFRCLGNSISITENVERDKIRRVWKSEIGYTPGNGNGFLKETAVKQGQQLPVYPHATSFYGFADTKSLGRKVQLNIQLKTRMDEFRWTPVGSTAHNHLARTLTNTTSNHCHISIIVTVKCESHDEFLSPAGAER